MLARANTIEFLVREAPLRFARPVELRGDSGSRATFRPPLRSTQVGDRRGLARPPVERRVRTLEASAHPREDGRWTGHAHNHSSPAPAAARPVSDAKAGRLVYMSGEN